MQNSRLKFVIEVGVCEVRSAKTQKYEWRTVDCRPAYKVKLAE